MDAANSGPGPPKAQAVAVKPGELLPSVLRTSADLGTGLSKAQPAPGTAPPGPAAAKTENEQGRHAPGQFKITPGELLGTSTLPRVDAAHHQALPARPALTMSPTRQCRGPETTPERSRQRAASPVLAGRAAGSFGPAPLREQQHLRSSGDGPPAGMVVTKAAAATSTSPGRLAAATPAGWPPASQCSSSAWKPPDVPAVGSVAMTKLPNAAAWLSGSPEARTNQAAAGAAGTQQQQSRNGLAVQTAAAAAAAGAVRSSSPAADDLRLMLPIDPTNPSYYWKPQPGVDGKAAGAAATASAAGRTIDRILGAQLLLDAGSGEDTGAPVSHVRQRKSILLRMPLGAELFLGAVPAVIQDPADHACLLVLPSDKPSNRKEAVAVEELLAALLQDPEAAVAKACQWRVATLGALCAESLGVVAEAIKKRSSGREQWQFRQLTRNLTGKMLGSHMAQAVGSLVSSSHPNPTAAHLAQLLSSKDAVMQAATAASEASLHAAAAVAPATVKPLKIPGGLTAVEAVASLDGASPEAAAAAHWHQQQHQQQLLQQQLSRVSHSGTSRIGGSSNSRSSRSGSLSPTVQSKQHAQSEQQQQPSADRGFFLCTSFPTAAAAAGSGSRRNTGTVGAYASLTVLTGAERASSGSKGNTSTHPPGSSVAGGPAAAAAAAVGSPGSRQASAAGQRSPSALSSIVRPSLSLPAAEETGQLQPGPEQQQQLHRPLPTAASDQGGSACNSPERSSRLQSGSSRCSSPVPALAPGTPTGYTSAGQGSPQVPAPATAAASRGRGGSPGAVGSSSSAVSSSQRPEGPGSAQRSQNPGSCQEVVGVAGTPGALLHTSSRLSSATGQNSPAARGQDHQQQHLALLPDGQAQGESPHSAAGAASSSSSSTGDGDDRGGQLAGLYGLSLAAAICVADIVRQVEVACVERGHALAYAWNCSISAAEAVMVELRSQNQHLLGINSDLAAGQVELAKELKAVDFLRREALRFRHAMEDAQEQLGHVSDHNSKLKVELEAANSELAAVEEFANRRLSRLRWRNAFAVLGTWSQQSVIQSGLTRADRGRVLPKVKMLEKLVQAVTAVEHRKAAYGRGKAAGQPETGIDDVAQVMRTGPRMTPNVRGQGSGYSSDNSAQMLSVLTPEARTLVLAAMPASQRWRVLEAMRDEERAEIVIAMGLELRKDAAAALEPKTWERTIDIVKNSGNLASRYLKSWDVEEAAKEFLLWGTFQQVDCLASLDAYTAAAILTRAPESLRKDLLGMLEPFVAANIVQAMLPPPAAAAMEGLEMKKAMAILIAMDPNKAADVLTEMGSSQAASKLIFMDADTRNSIIENMAPRAAASTLTSMEDAMQAIGSDPGSPEMLTLNGGTTDESPVMGALSDLDPNNAYTIMSYMSIKDKAALLAGMEPDAVARLLGCMDPNEAVLLLSALGDSTSKLVSNHLTTDERDSLVEVLQGADCRRADFADRARLRGSFRDAAAPDALGRLVGAYEAITAEAMQGVEDGDDAPPEEPAPSQGRARIKHTTSSKDRPQRQQEKRKGSQQQVASSVNSINTAGLPVAAAVVHSQADDDANSGQRRTRTTSSIGSILPAERSDSHQHSSDTEAGEPGSYASTTAAAADAAVAAAGTGMAAKGGKQAAAGPGKGRKAPAVPSGAASAAGAVAKRPAAGAADRRLSSSNAGGVETSEASHVGAAAAAAAGGSAAGAAAATGAGCKAGAAAGKPRRTRQSDADASSSGAAGGAAGHRATGRGAPGPEEGAAVPGLRANSSNHTRDEAGVNNTQRTWPAEAEQSLMSTNQDAASGNSTPRATTVAPAAVAAAPKASTGQQRAPAAAAAVAKGAAAGRKALKDALKSQAVAKKAQVTAAAAAAATADTGAGAVSSTGGGKHAAEEDLDALLGHSIGGGAGIGGSASTPPAEAPPQVKLGRVPKNARLIEAMAQHKNAKPKPKGWLMAVVDSIYKEGETLLRKLGRSDMLKKQSVPEIVFAYFHNKYGQRALVNENVGSLVNTLTLYQHTDLRLEAFARQLSEEWDVSIFVDFIIAQNLCLQPSKVACIEYPRDAGKDEQYPWVCLWKAVSVSDSILGARAQAARERFNEFLQMASLPADEADIERFRRERREAAAKDSIKLSEGDLPERFYKLPRIRFLLLLCKELLRINRYIITFAEDRFTAMDVQRSGKINVVAVRSFVKSISPGVSDAQVSEHISTFVSTAEGAVRDIAPEQVSVPSVTELTQEAFVAGVSNTQAVRDHVKLHKLPPARLEEENEEAQIFFSLLGVLMARHSKALLPTWQAALDTAGQRASNSLQQQLAVVAASGTGTDARFKAYIGLLLGLINVSVQAYIDGLLSSEAQADTLHSDLLETGLLRLEDAALILVCDCSYLLAEDTQELALARTERLPLGAQICTMGKQLLTHRRMHQGMLSNAAAVLQRVWRHRQRQRQLMRTQAAAVEEEQGKFML